VGLSDPNSIITANSCLILQEGSVEHLQMANRDKMRIYNLALMNNLFSFYQLMAQLNLFSNEAANKLNLELRLPQNKTSSIISSPLKTS